MMSPTPHVFVSASSSDLASARIIVGQALMQLKCLPIEESLFSVEHGRIREMQERLIDPCQAVIHLVGRDYGGEPDQTDMPDGQLRRSWTQLEYDYVVKQNKKLYVIICDKSFPFDEAEPQPDKKGELQQAHRDAVLKGEHVWHQVKTEEELREAVLQMKLPLDELRQELEKERLRKRRQVGAVLAVLAFLFAAAIVSQMILYRTVDDVSDKLDLVLELYRDSERIKKERKKQIDDGFTAELKAMKEEGVGWEEILELERRRDLAQNKMDDLIRTIKQELEGKPDEFFLEASRLLAEEGVDAAIAYLAIHEEDILARANRLAALGGEARDEKRKALKSLLLKAELHETKAEFDQALQLYQVVADRAPKWSRARRQLGSLLRDMADHQIQFRLAESHLKAALDLAEDNEQRASCKNALGILYLQQARYGEAQPLLEEALELMEQFHGPEHSKTATVVNNLAALLQATNRLAEAEPLLRRGLAIDERSYGAEHFNVAVHLHNLAALLQSTNRLIEAEQLIRRALAIDAQSWGAEHPAVARDLNALAQLLQDTNRLVEAEQLMRRALTIDEQAYGTEHPRVANRLNNLAALLQFTNRLKEAEPLIRRALAISRQSYGAEHPDVATGLNNLASLLQGTNRQGKAKPLVRRGLAIDERFYGAEHPKVATCLGTLAQFLLATNRVEAAEPLLRRALEIDEQCYGAEHPSVALDLSNLAHLLKVTNRVAEAEPLLRRALAIDKQSYGAKHPDVARDHSNLAQLLQDTNRVAEAEPLLRRALVIDEQSYGAEHPDVARDLWNLAQLLQATNRVAEAEPLMRRALEILVMIGRPTAHEHPHVRAVERNYAAILQTLETQPDEIAQRLQKIAAIEGPFPSILSEVERLLGAATAVDDVLAGLDAQYRAEGRPEVYFLESDQPIAPHLEKLLIPTRDGLAKQGIQAYFQDRNAEAVVLYDAAIELNHDQADAAEWLLINQMNRGGALRNLGALEQAREELTETASTMRQSGDTSATVLGNCLFHRALCEFRLGMTNEAKATVAESLQVYDDAPQNSPVSEGLVEQSRKLLADLEDGKERPPRVEVDVEAELRRARERFEAAQKLATLPLDEPTDELMGQMLGPAKSVDDVLKELDEQNRKDDNPAVWFLPLDEPISPHLDELLGPIQEAEPDPKEATKPAGA